MCDLVVPMQLVIMVARPDRMTRRKRFTVVLVGGVELECGKRLVCACK